MLMEKNKKEGRTIAFAFPAEKFKGYLKNEKVNSVSELTMTQTENIFFKIRGDFLKGKLGFDEFSSFCHELWWKQLMKDKASFETKLGQILYTGSELSFYLRTVCDKNGGIFLDNLREVLNYGKEE
jgi:hypothetical protein